MLHVEKKIVTSFFFNFLVRVPLDNSIFNHRGYLFKKKLKLKSQQETPFKGMIITYHESAWRKWGEDTARGDPSQHLATLKSRPFDFFPAFQHTTSRHKFHPSANSDFNQRQHSLTMFSAVLQGRHGREGREGLVFP